MPPSIQYDIFRAAAPFALGILAILLAASFGENRRRRPSIRVYSMFVAVTMGYLGANYLEMSSTSEGATLFWSKAIYLFIGPMPVIWLDFCLRFAREGVGLRRALKGLAFLVPVATIVVVFVPGLTNLMWSEIEFLRQGSFVISVREHGPWFAVYAAYTYGLYVLGAVIAVKAFAHYRRFFRRQTAWILAGLALPLSTSLAFVLRPFPGLVKDFTPLGYAAAALLFFIALFYKDLFLLVPVERAQVVERLAEGVLVLDTKGVLVDANPAAMRMLGIGEKSIGRELGGYSPAKGGLPAVAPEFLEAIEAIEVSVPRDMRIEGEGGVRNYRVESSSLTRGTLVVVTDQTELRELLARVEMLAMKDELTGLPNRRSFLAEGGRELARARRRGLSLAAAMIDFDGFKSINDERGHAAGDAVLRGFGAIVAEEARADDIIGRIGGDEFAILAAGGPGAMGVRYLCDRLRRRLAAADFRDESGNPVPATISVGIAALGSAGEEGVPGLEKLLADADTALYAAKRKGRNAISIFGEE